MKLVLIGLYSPASVRRLVFAKLRKRTKIAVALGKTSRNSPGAHLTKDARMHDSQYSVVTREGVNRLY